MLLLCSVVFGLLLGSFFNVLICRLPEKRSIMFPASHCPDCKAPIKPWHNIPVISYIILKGKCHSCHTKISALYPAIELLTAAAAAGVWTYVNRATAGDFTLASLTGAGTAGLFLLLLIPISAIDLKHYIIPDSLSLSLLILGLLVSFIPGQMTPLQAILGILAGGGSLYLIGLIGELLLKKEAMGGGDVKLMAAAGAFFGPVTVLLAIMFGALLGAFYGISIMVLKKLNGSHQIPFGPFLGAGVWIALFFGHSILNAYLTFIGAATSPVKPF